MIFTRCHHDASAWGRGPSSALKFQADMGVLLAFMFFLNMPGAIFLLPAMAAFLLKLHGLAEMKPLKRCGCSSLFCHGVRADAGVLNVPRRVDEWWPPSSLELTQKSRVHTCR